MSKFKDLFFFVRLNYLLLKEFYFFCYFQLKIKKKFKLFINKIKKKFNNNISNVIKYKVI